MRVGHADFVDVSSALKTPIFIGEIELTEPIGNVETPARSDNSDFQGARLLVRLGQIPVGYVELDPTQFDQASVACEIWRTHATTINKRLEAQGGPLIKKLPLTGVKGLKPAVVKSERPFISVVMCTRDRPDSAIRLLHELDALKYENFEVIAVDNNPSTNLFEVAFEAEFEGHSRIRYIAEPRPGVSCAKNRGVNEARGTIIAFTDDDVFADPCWLEGIVRGFERAENVACVTGLIPSAELENDVQLYFDNRLTWGASFEPRIFDLVDNRDSSPLYPFSAGIFGTGANFAVSRLALIELGGFDEALGGGVPAGGGEDIDMFMKVILGSYKIVYEPSAIVSHVHRVDLDQLNNQMFRYGSGFTATLTAQIMRDPRIFFELAKRAFVGVRMMRKISARTEGKTDLPAGLVSNEFVGMLWGPLRYFQGLRKIRKANRALGPAPAWVKARA